MSGRGSDNARVVKRLVGVIITMGALAWLSVPAYDMFCRVTGWGGAVDVADAAMDEPLDQTITIRFDATRSARSSQTTSAVSKTETTRSSRARTA